MTIEIKVPQLPESISDATVSTWHKKQGERVLRDENIVDLETDKVMLEVVSPSDGILKEIKHQTGDTVHTQEVLAIVESGSSASEDIIEKSDSNEDTQKSVKTEKEKKPSAEITSKTTVPTQKVESKPAQKTAQASVQPGPSARRAAAEHGQDLSRVSGTGKSGRITKENVMTAISGKTLGLDVDTLSSNDRPEKRVPMSRMRARIAERLLEVTQTTAMLTTFNEINMSAVMGLRSHYKEKFEKKFKVRLGFMSFFVRACVEALKRSPIVNASIDGNEIVYHGFYDIGVAVSTERGLVVPVLRDADKMSMAQIETQIIESAEKARSGKLSLEEMQGGTFTVTNGGIFGSLMATPLLNSPQCAILGMHKIQERPIAENGQVVIRPMMYVALSYDHRLVDGKESVTFLVTIKELLEDPTRFLLEV